jgi:hypothetical protein
MGRGDVPAQKVRARGISGAIREKTPAYPGLPLLSYRRSRLALLRQHQECESLIAIDGETKKPRAAFGRAGL